MSKTHEKLLEPKPIISETFNGEDEGNDFPEVTPSNESWESFLEALYSSEAGIRERAVLELPAWHKAGRDVSEALEIAIRDPEPLVSRAAAIVVGRIRITSQAVLQAVSERLHAECDVLLRRTLVTALSRLGTSGVSILITMLGDSDVFLREFAAAALEELGSNAVPVLLGAVSDERLRPFLPPVLEHIGSPAVPGLIALLNSPDNAVRDVASDVLERIGPLALSQLLEGVESNTVSLQNGAQAVSRFGAAAVQPLVKMIYGENVSLRCWAADVLVSIGRPAVPAVITMLREKHVGISYLAGETLAKFGACAIPELIQSLETSERSIRWIVGNILGRIGAEAVQPLENALIEGNPLAREAAAHALGEMGNLAWAALPTLEEARDNESESFVREAIEQAIEKLERFE